MATGDVVGRIEVASIGNVKIVGVDGVMRDATYEGLMYEGEQIVSNDPETLFQIRYLALPEATVYEGVFGVLADGSVIADVSELETLFGNDIDFMETAAGDGEPDANSGIPEDAGIVADTNVQGFGRGENSEVGLHSRGADPLVDDRDSSDLYTGDEAISTMSVVDDPDYNDRPVVSDVFDNVNESYDDTDVLGVDDTEDEPLTEYTGVLAVSDADAADTHTYEIVGNVDQGNVLVFDEPLEDVDVSISEVNGEWVYTVTADASSLAVGETADISFKYVAIDSSGPGSDGGEDEPARSLPATITLTIAGTNDQPIVADVVVEDLVLEGVDSGNVYTFTGELLVEDADLSDTHTFHLVGTPPTDANDNGQGDPGGEGEPHTAVVTVTDANGDPLDITAHVMITDAETGDFKITGNFDSLADGEEATVTFSYYAVDDNNLDGTDGINETSVSEVKEATLTITGTDDTTLVVTDTDTLDLSSVSGLNTVVLEAGASVVNEISPGDVLDATNNDILTIRSYDGDASDQVDVHDSFGVATETLNDGQWYAEYSTDDATLLIEIDPPIDAV